MPRRSIGAQTMTIWPLIVLQLLSFSILSMGCSKSSFILHSGSQSVVEPTIPTQRDLLGAMSIYVITSAPNKRSLGEVNGLART
jgi:hypothetical protein